MKMLAISLTTIVSALAMGKASTEYYYQPAAGVNAVELIYSNSAAPLENEVLGVKTDLKTTASDFIIRYARGIDERHAWGLYTFFGSKEYNNDSSGTNVKHTADGMGDIHAFYKAFFGDNMHWDADLGVNTEKVKIDTASGSVDNRSTGGSSLKLGIGKMWTDNSWNYGADLSYLALFERTVDNAASTKLTGGDNIKLAGFGEYNHGNGFVGAEIGYNAAGDLKTKTSGVTSTLKAENFFNLKLYGTYEFNEMWTGLLSFNDAMHADQDITPGTGQSNAYNETTFNVGARMTF